MNDQDMQILDIGRLDDPQLKSMLDVPLVAWARQCLEMGLKPVPKKTGKKYPAIAWEPYQTRFPRRDELTKWFARDDIDGVCAVLDGTRFAVIDLDGAPDHARQLLTDVDIQIPGGRSCRRRCCVRYRVSAMRDILAALTGVKKTDAGWVQRVWSWIRHA